MNDKSNSIPKQDYSIPNSLLSKGKILQFFSSSLAAKFVHKLFITPSKYTTPERELMMRKSAKNILEKVPGTNKEIMIYEYGFSKTKILLTHGWGGRGTQLYEIADKLLENGMMVIAYDAPAHGQSNGKKTGIQECVKIVKYVNEKYGPFEAAVGHSFGGITLLNAQSDKPFINKLVVIGIEGSINKIIDVFVKTLQLKQKVATKVKKLIHSKYNKDVEVFAAYKAAKNISIPTLVIHDTQDKDVNVSSAFKLRQNLKNGLLLVTNGLGHHKILRDKKVITKIIDFIKV